MCETLITCHSNADSDAIGALAGALLLYPDAVLLFPGSQEKQIQDFYDEVDEVSIFPPYEAWYRSGRFGAIPHIEDIENIFKELNE